METMKFRAIFHYDGKEPGWNKGIIEKLFMNAYNLWCDDVNPRLEEWNDAPDCPDDAANGTGSKYNAYIREKSEVFAKELTRLEHEAFEKFPSMNPFEKFFVGEECQFCAKLTDGTTMNFSVEPM